MNDRKGLILDFGGVLTTPLLTSVTEFESDEGLPQGSLLRQLSRDPELLRLTEDLERGSVTQAHWNEVAAQRIGVGPGNLLGRIFSGLRPEPLMYETAAAARQQGIRVGLLSNSVGRDPWDLYAGCDLDTTFDAVLISEEHGLRKPEPAIYEHMLKMLELPGSACVFVDDSPHNLPPAAALGMATVHARDPRATITDIQNLLGLGLPS
ncbi:HAD-IA family hydrolase [Streptomyces sp. NPDC052092]|uniref:HAD-IA family hydrolase n=1 Tax=Streptomyces sp. NPDC052092 TaxID=3365685 RepID=UPI0037D7E1A6